MIETLIFFKIVYKVISSHIIVSFLLNPLFWFGAKQLRGIYFNVIHVIQFLKLERNLQLRKHEYVAIS